jgi:zinc D-Ala-D-Ala dipeptidase
VAALAVLALAACTHAPARSGPPPAFVDVSTLAPGLVVDMRYAGPENFVGRPIAG